MRSRGYSRFNTQDIADSPCLIAVLLVCLTDGVDIVDTQHPLILCELDLSAEVVHVFDQAAEDLSMSGLGLGAHEVDDMVGKVGIESAAAILCTIGTIGAVGSAVGAHDVDYMI